MRKSFFPKEYFVYFKEKWRGVAEKDPLSGYVDNVQMCPLT